MKLLLKILAGLTLGLALAAIMAFAGYDLLAFQPHVREIKALLESADVEDKAPPQVVKEFIMLEPGAGPATQVARQLLTRFVPSHQKGCTLGQHGRFFLWDRLVRLHLSQDEIISLHAALAYNGAGGYGLNSLALRLYGKKLSELSRVEAATVVVYVRSPVRYRQHPEELAEPRDRLLARANVE